ncbi:hypothetical protein E2C01_026659 [Portunus trituberculatus]|uniref:Uncharacterized protein n=1 Tax=Portunus trituberculatus TaxID=210409 RepID=A0A5B7EIS2_PORTR|nr:hypothetical protein [Portunus trituberculatus]
MGTYVMQHYPTKYEIYIMNISLEVVVGGITNYAGMLKKSQSRVGRCFYKQHIVGGYITVILLLMAPIFSQMPHYWDHKIIKHTVTPTFTSKHSAHDPNNLTILLGIQSIDTPNHNHN